MKDTRKIRVLIILGCLLAFLFVIGSVYVFTVVTGSKRESVIPKTQSTQSTSQIINQSDQSEDSQQSDAVEDPEIKTFLTDYFTWDLTENSVENREMKLKNQLSDSCYRQLAIESDSQSLIEAIKKYDDTKEINTSNSTQLISSKYVSSEIYQDIEQPSSYSVQVRVEQKAPYQKETKPIEKSFRLYMQDNKIIQFKEVTKQ